MSPSRKAAALQRGLQRLARSLALRIPPRVINFGAQIEGEQIDPVPLLALLPEPEVRRHGGRAPVPAGPGDCGFQGGTERTH
eukprot:6621955-Pyramimonas_sp.AAC.1